MAALPSIFSPRTTAQAIQSAALPREKRRPPVQCEGAGPWLQRASDSPVVIRGESAERHNGLSEEELKYYASPEGILALNKEGITQAVERRVALFFQQAILCFRMSSFVFSAKGAEDQIGTASPITFSSTDGKSVTHRREAAHCSTIPTLIATAKDGSSFVYLKGGSNYAQHNATIGMHEWVNGADELIDGKREEPRLRKTAVAILNLTAKGLDPVRATKKFLRAFDKQVLAEIGKLEKEDGRRLVLKRYHRDLEAIQEQAKHKEFYDHLIGVIVRAEGPEEEAARKVIYEKRYEIIRCQAVVESQIGKLLAEMKKKMQGRDSSLLKEALLTKFRTTEELKTLEKLFSKTAAFLEKPGDERGHKTLQTKVSNVMERYKKELSVLERDLREKFRELSSAEFTYRAGLFKELRTKVKVWTQKEFCEYYLDETGYSVSQSWVSRMEQPSRVAVKDSGYITPLGQRQRLITVEEAKRCAATFGIDAGAFLPSLFTSSY